jgi:para-aminobenzoate synthetase component I
VFIICFFVLKRIFKSFEFSNDEACRLTLLEWAGHRFPVSCFLNSNDYPSDRYSSISQVLALGSANHCMDDGKEAFTILKSFVDTHNDWLFGFLTYDLKNQIEHLASNNYDGIKMPDMHFFQPIVVIFPEADKLNIGCLPGFEDLSDPQAVFRSIMQYIKNREFYAGSTDARVHPQKVVPAIRPRVAKEDYIKKVLTLKDHIQKGDIYEANYCVEFYARDAHIEPVAVYHQLIKLSPTPFSCLYRLDDWSLICASPERFIKKQGARLISQPIKGTIARGKTPYDDERQKSVLFNDPKERSENIMIVDLVRNDLSRTAKDGSVFVEELCRIYPFEQVHHMISTVISELDPLCHPVEAIRQAFPMGSMTGAPKVRAMQLIEEVEDTKRGLYSGTVGYFTPGQDFDFNVVIRSILYNAYDKYLGYMAGSAITAGSDPLKEYEECLLKAEAMKKTLINSLPTQI